MLDPKTLHYQKTHEWLSRDGVVGISDHAQKEITDVVFIEPPKAGRILKKGEPCCVVESVKAAFDIYAPASGEVAAVNEEAVKDPSLVNREPFGGGWLFKLKLSKPEEISSLMDRAHYDEFLASPEAAGGGH